MISKIEGVIKKVVGDKKFLVTASEKPEFGHYSTNAAFVVGGDPQKLADEILRQAQDDKETKDLFEKYEVKGKFINFWISKNALVEGVAEAVKLKKLRTTGLTRQTSENPKLKINLEFVSANPTGPLTMANGRGGFLGDALANVFETVGHKITREYYINDAGNQVRLLGESILAALGKAEAKDEHYKGGYVKTLAAQLETKIKNTDAFGVGRMGAGILLKEIRASLKGAGIEFDEWFSEYENLHAKKEIPKVLELLSKKGLVEEKDGAKWLKTSDIEDKDRVLVKSDGSPTYFLSDLAYHYDKLIKRKFDIAINIWGADHHGYVARLKSGVKAMGIDPDRLQIVMAHGERRRKKNVQTHRPVHNHGRIDRRGGL